MSLSPLDIDTVTAVAREAARHESPDLEVQGVVLSGGSDYVEILLTVQGCQREPCRVEVGVFRDGDAAAVRSQIAAQLRRHIEQRPL